MSIECFSIHINDALLTAETSNGIEMIDDTEEEEFNAPIDNNASDDLGMMDEECSGTNNLLVKLIQRKLSANSMFV